MELPKHPFQLLLEVVNYYGGNMFVIHQHPYELLLQLHLLHLLYHLQIIRPRIRVLNLVMELSKNQ